MVAPRFRRAFAAALVASALPAFAAPSIAGTVRPGEAAAPRAAALSGIAPLRQNGSWLTDSQGRTVILHGFNLVAKVSPFEPAADGFSDADAAFLQQHGFNAVRLGVLMEGVEPSPGVVSSSYLDSIASTVQLLAAHGIYSLLDFHQDLYNEKYQGEGLPTWMVDDGGLPAQPQAGFPGNYFAMPALWRAFDNLWSDAPGPGGTGLREWYDTAVTAVASRFKDDPAVLGYDLFNEPYPGSDYAACFPPAGCPLDDQTKLAPFMASAVQAVHAVDPGHLAFVEPWLMFDYSAPTYLGKVGSGPVGFSFHVYCLAALGARIPDSGPPRTTCNQVEQSTVDNALAQAAAGGQVPLLSEFGATSDPAELSEVISLADAAKVGWLEWAFCSCDDPTGSGSAESLVYSLSQPPSGSNVNQSNLALLDEPYPTAIAGAPRSYGYNPSSGTFSLDYVPTSGGTTDVHVPALHYPSGYRVQVVGATVVSAPGADPLVLQNDPSAVEVTVEVSAA